MVSKPWTCEFESYDIDYVHIIQYSTELPTTTSAGRARRGMNGARMPWRRRTSGRTATP